MPMTMTPTSGPRRTGKLPGKQERRVRREANDHFRAQPQQLQHRQSQLLEAAMCSGSPCRLLRCKHRCGLHLGVSCGRSLLGSLCLCGSRAPQALLWEQACPLMHAFWPNAGQACHGQSTSPRARRPEGRRRRWRRHSSRQRELL